MNAAIESRLGRWRGWLWWLIPFAALALLLGVEIDWGRALHRLPEAPAPIEPKTVAAALLPEYRLEGGLQAHTESVSRTLFNPTRRPAPVLAADAQRTSMPKGQFVLTGTAVAGSRHLAFLREVNGGKSRVVRQGDQINGVLVAEVKADRVRFTLADDFEEIVLKTQAGPKTTLPPPPMPPPTAAAPAPGPGLPGAAPPASTSATGEAPEGAPPTRRRAVPVAPSAPATGGPGAALNIPQAAPAAAPATPSAAPATQPAAGQGMAASPDPAWNEVYERMRQRNPQPTQ
jgi:hypothetical protein